MTPGAYIDAILECLGGGLDMAAKAEWLQTGVPGSPFPDYTRLDAVLAGQGVYVLAEAAGFVDGMVAT